MRAPARLFILALAVTLPHAALARKVESGTYAERAQKSDLVVIATPVGRTVDTAERANLPGIAYHDRNNQPVPVQVIGVETPFAIAAVLKGDAVLKALTLHHYRHAKVTEPAADEPALVSFDPTTAVKRSSFLMFLTREPDGRYAPAAGQTDPGFISIIPVPVDTDAALLQTLNTLSGQH